MGYPACPAFVCFQSLAGSSTSGGLKLYVRRVFISDDVDELLPRWVVCGAVCLFAFGQERGACRHSNYCLSKHGVCGFVCVREGGGRGVGGRKALVLSLVSGGNQHSPAAALLLLLLLLQVAVVCAWCC